MCIRDRRLFVVHEVALLFGNALGENQLFEASLALNKTLETQIETNPLQRLKKLQKLVKELETWKETFEKNGAIISGKTIAITFELSRLRNLNTVADEPNVDIMENSIVVLYYLNKLTDVEHLETLQQKISDCPNTKDEFVFSGSLQCTKIPIDVKSCVSTQCFNDPACISRCFDPGVCMPLDALFKIIPSRPDSLWNVTDEEIGRIVNESMVLLEKRYEPLGKCQPLLKDQIMKTLRKVLLYMCQTKRLFNGLYWAFHFHFNEEDELNNKVLEVQSHYDVFYEKIKGLMGRASSTRQNLYNSLDFAFAKNDLTKIYNAVCRGYITRTYDIWSSIDSLLYFYLVISWLCYLLATKLSYEEVQKKKKREVKEVEMLALGEKEKEESSKTKKPRGADV
eukprot:TRINITY_DN11608_c0_g1_i1.p1 TRINITY_DN11608_c0_g1~~TRINITY_DN11608_c0_g1_i1.p1  ORF type:complete len:396 (+),score=35.76 TRINITY_DN11608_c0_g1_i1:64-1251(+)